MKNFGIKTKKFVRKITAIASAALMAGLSMGVAAANLSSLSSTFIQNGNLNAYVVVGTGGQSNVLGFAEDVAGSIVVASAFAQQAKSTAATSGSAILERNVTTGDLNGSFVAFGASVPSTAETWTQAKSGFSWLPNQTIGNSTSISYVNVTGVLTANAYTFLLGTNGNYTVVSDALVYNVTFNNLNTETAGTKYVVNGTKGIPFPDGKGYQITNWTYSANGAVDGINVTLGEYTSVTSATTGQVYNIGDTGATFQILSYSTSPTHKLNIKLLSSNGTTLFNNWVAKGESIYSGEDFSLILSDYNVPGGVVDATIDWSTSATKLQNGREHTSWPGWKVWLTGSASGINSIAWKYTPESTVSIVQGQSQSMLSGFFNVVGGAFKINSTDQLEKTATVYESKSSAKDIYFVDENATTHSIDVNLKSGTFDNANRSIVSSWIDSLSFTLVCEDKDYANLTRSGYDTVRITNNSPFYLNSTSGNLTNYEITANITWQGASSPCTSAAYNLTILNATSVAGNPLNYSLNYLLNSGQWSNVSSTKVNGTVTLTEHDLKTVVLTYKEGGIDSIVTTTDGTVLSSDGTRYTPWGTKIVRSSNVITLHYPEAQRHGAVSVGREGKKEYTLTAGSYNSELDVTLASSAGTSVSINNIDVGMAKLDSELSTVNKPVILIGGPAVNSLVKQLSDAAKIDMGSVSNDQALVQLVSDAFDSNSALVIAGYAGKDTRLAAQVVASQVLGTDMGLTGSSAILNTGVSSYTQVTVV